MTSFQIFIASSLKPFIIYFWTPDPEIKYFCSKKIHNVGFKNNGSWNQLAFSNYIFIAKNIPLPTQENENVKINSYRQRTEVSFFHIHEEKAPLVFCCFPF